MKNFNLNDNQIKELKNILENDYEEIREFYYNACTNEEYDCKIFLTRRSYVLYRIFVAIFQREDPNFKVRGKIFNTHSIGSMRWEMENISNIKILILDDIIINGRTVTSILNDLKNVLGELSLKEITIWCIVRNQEANCLSDISSNFGHYRYVTPDEWRKLSNKLTKFIISSNIGYVSFVDTYYIDNKYFPMIEERFSYIDKYSEKCAQLNELGVISDIYFYSFPNVDTKKYQIKTCIRLYRKDNSITIVPYVFLPAVLKGDSIAYCIELLHLFSLNAPDKLQNQGCEVLLYQWTINQLSKQLFGYFCVDLLGYYLSCEESFKESLCLEKQKQICFSNNLKSDDVDECCKIFESALRDVSKYLPNNFENALESYLNSLYKLDENRARTETSRHKGIKIQDIFDIINKTSFPVDENNVLGAIIHSWDIGKSSYVISEDYVSNGVSVIAGFIRNGEQAYRILYEQYNFQYRVLYYMFLKTYVCDKKTINMIVTALDEKYRTAEFSEFYNKINFNNYFSDLLSVKPKSNTYEELRFNQIKKFINEYLKTLKC